MGRGCHLAGLHEVSDLRPGLDFRRIEYRREVFLRFYAFHLQHRAHPGAVYYVIPYLRDHFQWSVEQAYWWAFLNGNTQHPVTSTILWNEFPEYAFAQPAAIKTFLDRHWRRLEFDTDRRYWKVKLPDAVAAYRRALDGRSQREYFRSLTDGATEDVNFSTTWKAVRSHFLGFGRLSAWSYLEYLRILGLPIQPGDLMLWDRDGSKSHRNGLCKVLGRDELDWHDDNQDFDGKYAPHVIEWLSAEAQELLADACARQLQPMHDVTFFTLESTLCCYKSWHRKNRRYPNVYNDMFHDRIVRAEQVWGADCPIEIGIFWDARKTHLPPHLRLEDCPGDVGLDPLKQNHYRTTGEVIMMEHFDPVFANSYNKHPRVLFDLPEA